MKVVVSVVILAAVAGGAWLGWQRWERPREGLPTLYGTVEIRDSQLAFNNEQKVTRVLVDEGDRVVAGQLLATLDTARLSADVASRQAAVAAQEQVVRRLVNGTRPEEIDQAKAEVNVAEVRLDNAQRLLERVQKAGPTAITGQEMDNAQAAVRQARAQLDSARAALRLAEIGPREEEIAQAKAQLAGQQADLGLAQARLADTSLYAPAAGVIRSANIEPGEMANPSRPAFTLAVMSPKWVRAYVSEKGLGHVRPGMEASVYSDSAPNRPYDGWIGFISPEAEFTPKNVQTEDLRTALMYEVRVYVGDPRDELRLGMPVTVRLTGGIIAPPATEPTTASTTAPTSTQASQTGPAGGD